MELQRSFEEAVFAKTNKTQISMLPTNLAESLVTALSGLVSSPLLFLCLLTVACVLWHRHSLRRKERAAKIKLPPGSYGLPFIGETLHFLVEGYDFYENRQKIHGDVYKTHLLGMPVIRVTGAANLKTLFNGEHTLVSTKWPLSTRVLLGDGAISACSGATHRLYRKHLLEGFSDSSLRQYVRPIQKTVCEYLSSWCAKGTVFGYEECRNMAFSIACRLLIGIYMGKEQESQLSKAFQEFTDNVFSLPFDLPGFGLHKGLRARKLLQNKIEECVKQKLENKEGLSHPDVLSNVLQHVDDQTLPIHDLKDQILELMFAGHETTASAACSLLLNLHRHPEVVESACAELHELGLLDVDEDTDLSYDVLGKMEYVGWVVKEVLRVVPPVGGVYKTALKTFEIGGYEIPEGSAVVCGINGTHKTSDRFPDFHTFDPTRWQHTRGRQAESQAGYFPFGAGGRSCAGKDFAKLTLKIFTVEILRGCSWRLLNDKPRMVQFPVPHPVDKLPVEFREAPSFRRRAFSF